MFEHRKRLSVAIGALFIIGAASVAGHQLSAGPAKASAPPPAIQVDVATVVQYPVTDWQNYSGRLDAVERIDIRPQVAGAVVAVHVRDGGLVRRATFFSRSIPDPTRPRSTMPKPSWPRPRRAPPTLPMMQRGLNAC